MKRTIALVLLLLLMTTPADAFTANNTSIFKIGSVKYEINGVEKSMDTTPFILNDRTYVPVRYVAYGLGFSDGDISYADNTASFNGIKNVRLTAGVPSIYVDGTMKSIDAAPVIKDNRMFLPVRFVAEAFGADVDWDSKESKVMISGGDYTAQNKAENNQEHEMTTIKNSQDGEENAGQAQSVEIETRNSINEMCTRAGVSGVFDQNVYTVTKDIMKLKIYKDKLILEYPGGEKEVGVKNGLDFTGNDILVSKEDYPLVMSFISIVGR